MVAVDCDFKPLRYIGGIISVWCPVVIDFESYFFVVYDLKDASQCFQCTTFQFARVDSFLWIEK